MEDYVSETKKALLLWGVSFLVGFYCVFVMQQLWNWFAVPLLHFGEATFLTMYGLNLLVGLLTARDAGENPIEASRWRIVTMTLDVCVPVETRATLQDQLKEEIDGQWGNFGWWVFGIAAGYTVTLGVGFVIHIFV
jgi:hypothetical protein